MLKLYMSIHEFLKADSDSYLILLNLLNVFFIQTDIFKLKDLVLH